MTRRKSRNRRCGVLRLAIGPSRIGSLGSDRSQANASQSLLRPVTFCISSTRPLTSLSTQEQNALPTIKQYGRSRAFSSFKQTHGSLILGGQVEAGIKLWCSRLHARVHDADEMQPTALARQ